MALTCARCGTQNPDGNAFCQACGTQLVATAWAAPTAAPGTPPAGAPPPNWAPPQGPPPQSAQPAAPWLPPQSAPPPVAGPPPSAPPPSYQSPYYAPPPGYPQPPVHRTPWLLIISAIVGLVLLMAGCGTALAMINARNQPGSTVGSDLPSPTPAGTPSPVGQQTPSKGGANAASTSSVSATVPPGWVATTKDPVLQVTNPAGTGTIVMSSGSQTAQSAQQMKDAADQSLINQFPDIKACPNTKTTSGTVGGVSGIWWELCFTSTSGGQSFAGAMTIFVGVNAGGTVGYAVILLTQASQMNAFITEAKPVLQSIKWKLG
ncbi:MAG: zinc ribbon domain-containing protein [Chloroflexi bacterium]|nr:MAG: zinc ribbon domain-containing protein [Chloroflexota bacterium]